MRNETLHRPRRKKKGLFLRQAERVGSRAYGMLEGDKWELIQAIKRAIRSAYTKGYEDGDHDRVVHR